MKIHSTDNPNTSLCRVHVGLAKTVSQPDSSGLDVYIPDPRGHETGHWPDGMHQQQSCTLCMD